MLCLIRHKTFCSLLKQTSVLALQRATVYENAEHTKLYSVYRPEYPKEIFDIIIEFCSKSKNITFDLAVDVGCGTGQSTFGLCGHFKQVIGTDQSSNQIQQAKSKNVLGASFISGPGEDLSFLRSGNVDLVTIAQALYWLDIDRFYKEVERVLILGGALVVYGYNLESWRLENKLAQGILLDFEEKVLHEFKDKVYRHHANHFADFPLPFSDSEKNDNMVMRHDFSLDELIGFIKSRNSWQNYEATGRDTSVISYLRDRLCDLYSISPDDNKIATIHVEWPVYMMMGLKPEI